MKREYQKIIRIVIENFYVQKSNIMGKFAIIWIYARYLRKNYEHNNHSV